MNIIPYKQSDIDSKLEVDINSPLNFEDEKEDDDEIKGIKKLIKDKSRKQNKNSENKDKIVNFLK